MTKTVKEVAVEAKDVEEVANVEAVTNVESATEVKSEEAEEAETEETKEAEEAETEDVKRKRLEKWHSDVIGIGTIKKFPADSMNPRSRVSIGLTKPVTGFVKNEAGDFEIAETTTLTFDAGYLAFALSRINEDFSQFYAKVIDSNDENGEPQEFSSKHWGVLIGGTMKISSILIYEGDEIPDSDGEPADNDMFSRKPMALALSKKNQARIDKYLEF